MTSNEGTKKNPAPIKRINISTVVRLPYMKYGVLISWNVSTLYMFQYSLFINFYILLLYFQFVDGIMD